MDDLPLVMVDYMTDNLVQHLADQKRWLEGDAGGPAQDDDDEYLAYLPVEEE